MYCCFDCDTRFETPDTRRFSDSYDAHGSWAVSYFETEVCPHCLSDSFDEVEEDEECEDE